jgi:septum formation protein
MAHLWIGTPLLLASTSATRRQLVEAAGLQTETEAPYVDERAVEAAAAAERLSPIELAVRLAREKACAVSRRHPDRLVLGADQVLALGTRVFHKPADLQGAEAHLEALAGRTHELHSAAVLAFEGRPIESLVETARMTMRPLSQDAIRSYLAAAGDRALASVGSYQLEGLGVHLFDAIDGDHTTILGLPMLPLLAALRRRGCLAF